MNNQNLIKLLNKNLSINGMITIKKLAWSWEKDIAKKLENSLIEECQVIYGEDTVILTLSKNGEVFTVEIIIDSIYLEED